jgi:hypothetical protein
MNAGEAIGLNQKIGEDLPLIKQLGNLAVPANAYMTLADQWVLKKTKVKQFLTNALLIIMTCTLIK